MTIKSDLSNIYDELLLAYEKQKSGPVRDSICFENLHAPEFMPIWEACRSHKMDLEENSPFESVIHTMAEIGWREALRAVGWMLGIDEFEFVHFVNWTLQDRIDKITPEAISILKEATDKDQELFRLGELDECGLSPELDWTDVVIEAMAACRKSAEESPRRPYLAWSNGFDPRVNSGPPTSSAS